MKTVLAELGGQGWTPGDELAAVGRPDRRLVVLVPHQRPPERFAPEVAHCRTGPVAGDRSDESAVVDEVPRLEDAELVAFGIGEDGVGGVRTLTDVEGPGAEIHQPFDRVLLSLGRRARQIEVDAVLPPLRLARR